MKRMLSFVLEIALTLLPYILVLTILITTIAGIFHNKAGILTAAVFGLIAIFLSLKLVPFALAERMISSVGASNDLNKEIKIAAFNKLYSNTEYDSMDKILRQVDADLLGITEITEEDMKNIPSLKDYPYQISKANRDNATLSLYSKYPMKVISNHSVPHTLVIKSIIHDSQFIILLTHPKPMLNPDWLNMRNEELKSLTEYIKSQNNPVIALGDFNVTPWSNSYKLLSEISTIKNAARGTGVHFTTKGIFNAQVDHIFVPVDSQVNNFSVEDVSGSDHKLIWASVSL